MDHLPKISDKLLEKIDSIPSKPGVYQMKDFQGNVLYIGKSKNLKSRVKSYFYTQHQWKKIKRMVFHINDIDYIETDTHLEAQILECSLIKQLKPPYNAQFKNEKKYKYLKLENKNSLKMVSLVDEREKDCFGPYRSKNILLNILEFFQHIYPISKWNKSYEFNYNILPKTITKDFFDENRTCLLEILSKEEALQQFISKIKEKMKTAASEDQFELASIYRDIIPSLEYIGANRLDDGDLAYQDILLGERILEGYKIFYISKGRILHHKKYKRLSTKGIDTFLKEVQKRQIDSFEMENEKALLDYRGIILSELRDRTSKAVVVVEKEFDIVGMIDGFVEELRGVE